MKSVYSQTYSVSAGEANAEQELSLSKLTSDIIDIATAHANSLGIGNPAMKNLNAGWILSRLTIEMQQYPRANEEYKISTWIEVFNRHFSERSFKVQKENGETCGYVRSVWMVMNFIEHTNVGLSHLALSDNLIEGSSAPIERQKKHVSIIYPGEEPEAKMYLLATKPVFNYQFQYCDLDFYRHVNTVRYIELLLNRFSLEDHDSHLVRRMELSFMNEARYGMSTQLLEADGEAGDESNFLLREVSTKKSLLFARIFRKKRD